ncbi:hypothetical protein DUI87_17333 [Hirundo rustica rustica]|uniref:Tectonic domain-containing protein n=1 Tax=Hirundo rustica rustica TaxID=333673 RepID=A0A3M0K3P2_HIRRU|nr:hypothetical protein DUI87_17333 [Hirundo rustica rustica]
MAAAPGLGAFFVLILLLLPPLRAEEPATEPADTRDAAQARVRSPPAPVTDVARLCVCDLLVAQCDVNCCCDPDCSAQDFSLFTTCSVPVVTGDSQLCSQKAAVYSLDVEANPPERIFKITDQINPSIFCIHTTNYKQALYLKSPEIPTAENFDRLLDKFGGAAFSTKPDSWDLDTDPQNPPDANETSRYEVNITVQSIVVQSLNGMRTSLSSSDVLRLPMVLDELCINAVLGVNYHITHTDTGEIIEAAAAFVLGAISKEVLSIEQSFEISFTQSSCQIPVSLGIEVKWTKYGSLVNPQARIVNVTATITTSTLKQLPSGRERIIPITSSVVFTDISSPAEPSYKAWPTIDIKLPFDFFYPFV